VKAPVGWLILGVSLVLVAGRSLLAGQAVLRVEAQSGQFGGNRGAEPVLLRAMHQDSLLMQLTTPDRDPFGPPRANYVAPARPKPPVEVPPEPPKAVLLMQDATGTQVQIEVDGQTSGRMTVGSSFRGWTVTAITGSGITVKKGNHQYTLPRP